MRLALSASLSAFFALLALLETGTDHGYALLFALLSVEEAIEAVERVRQAKKGWSDAGLATCSERGR